MKTEMEPLLLMKWIPQTEERSGHIAARIALRSGSRAEDIEEFEFFDAKRPKLTEMAHIGFSVTLCAGTDDRAYWNWPNYYPAFNYVELSELRRGARVLGRIQKALNERAERNGQFDYDNVGGFVIQFAYAAGLKYVAFQRVEGSYDKYNGPIEWVSGGGSQIRQWIRDLHAKYDPKPEPVEEEPPADWVDLNMKSHY